MDRFFQAIRLSTMAVFNPRSCEILPVSQESKSTDDARHGLTNGAEGIPPNGGLVTEIPPKDVINSALGLTVIWPELQVPGF